MWNRCLHQRREANGHNTVSSIISQHYRNKSIVKNRCTKNEKNCTYFLGKYTIDHCSALSYSATLSLVSFVLGSLFSNLDWLLKKHQLANASSSVYITAYPIHPLMNNVMFLTFKVTRRFSPNGQINYKSHTSVLNTFSWQQISFVPMELTAIEYTLASYV